MNKLVIFAFVAVVMAALVTADHIHGHGFHGYQDHHGYKVSIEHHPHHHHGHHHHGGHGHSERYFHMEHHHGHHHHGHHGHHH
ncbi:hypothetical protein AVEN_269489-1 [Araneus ventricosus]|uniref:Histidine-rich glycoprotein n=1 Tax=Araneus ventricosus TaxID=182803 RepID=A0A4Y2MUT6_ARAVE|nr:hypothetical protein AVEN_269489-1 [Araneus ventricosus]